MLAEMEGKRLGIVGASGFIGGALARLAATRGWRVVGFSRHPEKPDWPIAEWRKTTDTPDVSGLDVLANFAGVSIDKRWTEDRKKQFRDSRVGVTRSLVQAIETSDDGPAALLNGSAVGIYGDRGNEPLGEDAGRGKGFLADLCEEWEQAALAAHDCRVITWRTGVVLGPGGAAWKKMRLAFSLGLGGRFGDGHQWMPWIHIHDLVAGMLHAIDHGLEGPVNGTAPEPVRNSEMTARLASALHRPAFLHAPAWALRLGLGEFASALLASQRALPEKLLEGGYEFRFPTLHSALEDLTGGDD
ncbi:epimerase family protein Rv2216 [Haloferula sargassicola]|uniref:Epimerase family protein Rv2216 n=2 Tax=Haloferula sargassicola TaxID=490096 RepID=A0ABP9UHA9_9BACT